MIGTLACDCCGDMVPREQIASVIAYGIETAACCACRGVEPDVDEADFPGFTAEQIRAGLTVLPVVLTEEEAARVCPVFRGPFITGSAG